MVVYLCYESHTIDDWLLHIASSKQKACEFLADRKKEMDRNGYVYWYREIETDKLYSENQYEFNGDTFVND
jgi:hypothetical protein